MNPNSTPAPDDQNLEDVNETTEEMPTMAAPPPPVMGASLKPPTRNSPVRTTSLKPPVGTVSSS